MFSESVHFLTVFVLCHTSWHHGCSPTLAFFFFFLILSSSSSCFSHCFVKEHYKRHAGESRRSCGPGDGCTVFLGLHAQSGDARRLPVRVHVQIVSVDAGAHAWTPEQTAHVALSHVTPWTGHAQEIGHSARSVGVRGHTGSH